MKSPSIPSTPKNEKSKMIWSVSETQRKILLHSNINPRPWIIRIIILKNTIKNGKKNKFFQEILLKKEKISVQNKKI